MNIEKIKKKERIVMLTAYDYQTAKLLDEVGIDLILVGDSLGMVVLGHKDTKNVTMQEMIHHTKAVVNGVKNSLIIGDMPIHTYDTVDDALVNAKKFIEAGAHGVKIEGNKTQVIRALLKEGIPVMGHLGLLPQTAEKYIVKGKEELEAKRIYDDALALDELGVFSVVLECVPENLAKKITENVKVPTIGIGAGKYCRGQVLVINDLLGMDDSFKPKHVKKYADLSKTIKNAVSKFKEEVLEGKFPDDEHTFH
jgi:3-methyl-2-oxobutanoate hydroxymethyltransferase